MFLDELLHEILKELKEIKKLLKDLLNQKKE